MSARGRGCPAWDFKGLAAGDKDLLGMACMSGGRSVHKLPASPDIEGTADRDFDGLIPRFAIEQMPDPAKGEADLDEDGTLDQCEVIARVGRCHDVFAVARPRWA